MKSAGAGIVAVLATWCVVGAQSPGRAVSWDRARAETTKYRATVDTSGLVDVDAQISPRVDAEDLDALCAARREAIVTARTTAEAGLRALPAGNDPITDERRATLQRQLGAVASFEGEMARARQHFEAGRDGLAPYAREYADLGVKHAVLAQAAAVAALRQGEIENCLVMPSADRCIVPLRPGGVHHHTAGAKAAFEQLTPLAAASPSNLELRWLLNLAAMVQGRYPEIVPEEARLPVDMFASETALPRLMDVASQARLGRMDTAGATITAAMDEEIEPAVVVVVGLGRVEPAQLTREAGRFGAVLERTVTAIAKQARRRAEIDAGEDDVEQPVIVEVVGDRGARSVHAAETRL
jgi:hypothetical protein